MRNTTKKQKMPKWLKVLLIVFGVFAILAGAGIGGYYGFIAIEKSQVAKTEAENQKVIDAFYDLEIPSYERFAGGTDANLTNIQIQGMTSADVSTLHQNTKLRFGNDGEEYDLIAYAKNDDYGQGDYMVEEYDFVLIINNEIREFKVMFNYEDTTSNNRNDWAKTIQTNSVNSLEDLEKFEVTNKSDEQLKLNGETVIDLYNQNADNYKILVGTDLIISYNRTTMEVSDFQDYVDRYNEIHSDNN